MGRSVYELCMAGLDRECEEAVEEMMQRCPWMDEADVVLFRGAAAWHFELTLGTGVVDWEAMAGAIWMLAQRAGTCGDGERQWGYVQWYAWTCAAMRGEEYAWQEWPGAVVC